MRECLISENLNRKVAQGCAELTVNKCENIDYHMFILCETLRDSAVYYLCERLGKGYSNVNFICTISGLLPNRTGGPQVP